MKSEATAQTRIPKRRIPKHIQEEDPRIVIRAVIATKPSRIGRIDLAVVGEIGAARSTIAFVIKRYKTCDGCTKNVSNILTVATSITIFNSSGIYLCARRINYFTDNKTIIFIGAQSLSPIKNITPKIFYTK